MIPRPTQIPCLAPGGGSRHIQGMRNRLTARQIARQTGVSAREARRSSALGTMPAKIRRRRAKDQAEPDVAAPPPAWTEDLTAMRAAIARLSAAEEFDDADLAGLRHLSAEAQELVRRWENAAEDH